ncbi:hypothetical protein YC2023_063400 [Brassica napus]
MHHSLVVCDEFNYVGGCGVAVDPRRAFTRAHNRRLARGVERGESVETIVHGLKPCLSRFLSMVFKENN